MSDSDELAEVPLEVTHDCPRHGEAVTLCCGRIPFELPLTDRMTLDQALVTCTGRRLSAGEPR